MEKGKYYLSAFLLLVVLTSSLYFVLNDNVRIDIQETRSIFKVNIDGKWVTSGIEYVNLFDGTAKMRASERTLDVETFGKDTIVTRTAQYKNNILVSETYIFDSSTSDVTLFPISHDITVIGADRPERPYILQYEVQKLLYTGETVGPVSSPQSFGHKMEVEWDVGNYYSRIFKYSGKDEGKLTIKYRIDSDRFSKNVRLFDPPENITVILNSPANNTFSPTQNVQFNCSMSVAGSEVLKNASLYTNQSGLWEAKNTTTTIALNTEGLLHYYKLDETSGAVIDSTGTNNATNNGATPNVVGKIETAYDFEKSNSEYIISDSTIGATVNQTICAWVKLESSSDANTAVATGNVGAQTQFAIATGVGGGGNFWAVWTGTGSRDLESTFSSTSDIGTFVFICIVKDSTGIEVYRNAVSGGTKAVSWTTPSDEIVIGANSGTSAHIDGVVDEVSIFDKRLNQSSIAELYNSDSGRRPTVQNSTQTWNRSINESTLWSCQACDTAGDCSFSSENRTVDFDEESPIITISFPENISYTSNVSDINYTVIESNPDKCWYSTDLGVTNSTPVVSGTNFPGVVADEGSNTWIVYCNDTLAQIGISNVTFFMDTNPPEIEYAPNSDTTNIAGDFAVKDWVFINVSVNETFEKNITFLIYSSGDLYSNNTFTNNTRDINYTNLPQGMYFWNVTICDLADQCNSTETRIYGVETTNLTIELDVSNITAELGVDVLINASNTLGMVYVDVDHPDYGVNYSNGLFETGFELIINWFRKTLFDEDVEYQELDYTAGIGTDENMTFNLSGHQYDEIVNVSVNITGTNNPLGVAFYKANSSEYDRVFFGNLTSDGNIQQDRLLDKSSVPNGYNKTQNISFDNAGTKFLYFLLDNNAKLVSFLLNVSSVEYGFTFSDSLTTNDYIDNVLTNATYFNYEITPSTINVQEFIFDDFEDGSINTSQWFQTPNVNIAGVDNEYDETMTTTETGGYLRLYVKLKEDMVDDGESDSETLTNEFYANNRDVFNLWTNENITFSMSFSGTGTEELAGDECDIDLDIYLGNSRIWSADYLGCSAGGSGRCDSDMDSSVMDFTIFKDHETGEWNVSISGVETYFFRAGSCFWGTYIKDYTAGSWSLDFSNPDPECVDSAGALQNTFLGKIGTLTPSLYFSNRIHGSVEITSPGEYGCVGDGAAYIPYPSDFWVYCYNTGIESNCINGPTGGWSIGSCSWEEVSSDTLSGCEQVSSELKIFNVNRSLGIPQNSTAVSTSVFDSSSNINSITTTVFGNFSGSGTSIPYMSGNNGDYWQNFVSGVKTPLINPGKHQKWKMEFEFQNQTYETNLPYLSAITMQAEPSNLSNVTFDFGNDGIIDYTIDGEFGPGNGTIQVNLSLADISSGFTGSALVGQTYDVPLIVGSASAGTLVVEGIDLIYNPNPVVLAYSAIQNYLTNYGLGVTIIPIILEASGINAIVNLTDLRFDYAGGNDTINVLAHNANYTQNVSRNITYYYSRWDYEWVPIGVEWIWFSPRKPTDVNVTPYGQTAIKPILNITNYGYGGRNADLSIYQTGSEGCVSTFISTNDTKPLSSLWDGLVSYWSFDFGAEDIIGLNDGTVIGAVNVDGDLQDNLIAWLKFNADGDLQDYTNNYPGSSSNTDLISFNSDGVYKGAYNIDGTDVQDKIKFGNEDVFEVGPHTFAFWVNPTSADGDQYLFDHYNWRFTTDSSTYRFTVGRMENATGPTNASGNSYTVAGGTPTVGEWVQLVGVYSPDPVGGNGFITLYIDGVNVSHLSIEHQKIWVGYGDDEAQLGNSDHGSTTPKALVVDDVRIYDTNLSASQIKALYERRLETLGNAYEFTADNQHILINAGQSPDNFTFNAWLNINNYTGLASSNGNNGLIGSYDNLAEGRISFFQDSNSVLVIRTNQTFDRQITLTEGMPSNEWYMLTVMRDSTNNSLVYKNGDLVGNLTHNDLHGDINFEKLFDNPTTSSWSALNGKGDEVRIYNRTLTQEEVTELYLRSVNKYYDTKLQSDWQLINPRKAYLENTDIYLWADYDCSYSTWRLFEPTYYFRQCVDGGACSTDII